MNRVVATVELRNLNGGYLLLPCHLKKCEVKLLQYRIGTLEALLKGFLMTIILHIKPLCMYGE